MIPKLDPKDVQVIAQGVVLGAAILTVLILIGLSLGLSPSISFGVPYQ